MENQIEPGIDVRTEILVKMGDEVLGMPISDIFDMDHEVGEWIPIHTNKRIYVVGIRNSFDEVEKIYLREAFADESFVEIIAGYKKRVVLSNFYPCAVIDVNRNLLGIKSARSISLNDFIPISRALQIFDPASYHDGCSGIIHLLRERNSDDDLKVYYVGRKVEEIASISAVTGYYVKTCKPTKTVPRHIVTGHLDVDTKLLRFKLKNSEYIATSSGILLHT